MSVLLSLNYNRLFSCDLFVWSSKVHIRHIGYLKHDTASFTKHININISTQGDLSLAHWVYSFQTIIKHFINFPFFWYLWSFTATRKETRKSILSLRRCAHASSKALGASSTFSSAFHNGKASHCLRHWFDSGNKKCMENQDYFTCSGCGKGL